MTLRDQLVEQALSLPPDDRAYVVDALEQSLPHEGFATPELSESWSVEIQRRLEAHHRGESRADDSDAVIERVRDQLVEFRARRGAS